MSEPELLNLARRVIVPLLDLRVADLAAAWATAREQVVAGFGGLILFGGELQDVRVGLQSLRAVAPAPGFLVCSDLERGLGQQVQGGAHGPPLLALGAADSESLAREAGRALGWAARMAGIDWVLGPVLDLAELPANPIVGSRSFGADPERVGQLASAYLRGIQDAGALACGKHFPGHGLTTGDSHAGLPRVDRSREDLERYELAPFRAAIAAGVGSLMTAHVAYPSLGAEARPATLTPAVVGDLLRGELGFEGLVVTDALIMDGVLEAQSESDAACAALAAGADVILYPAQPEQVAEALARWAAAEPANAARLRSAVGRLNAARAALPAEPAPGPDEAELATQVARAALTRLGPAQPPLAAGERLGVLLLDDDDQPGFGQELVAQLDSVVQLEVVTLGSQPAAEGLASAHELLARRARRVVVVGCQVRAWKGRPGLSLALGSLLEQLEPAGLTVVALCGPFPLEDRVGPEAELLLAYGDAPVCQAAAVEALLGRLRPSGRLPT